jgi:Domain of unknown function (DUF4160)
MPTVFEREGFRFFFYSNDHLPIHVHVRRAGGEAVFLLDPVVELRQSAGLSIGDLKRAQKLAEQHREFIILRWHECFD